MAPVMCGCKEQKYSYVPGVVNVKENLSFVSSAFDLKNLVLDATVCGTSSSLIQVTVVPVFTVTCCGVKVNWSMSSSGPAACADAPGKAGATASLATPSAAAMQVLFARAAMILVPISALQRLVNDGETLLPTLEGDVGDAE